MVVGPRMRADAVDRLLRDDLVEVAALLATAKVDDAAKQRIVAALSEAPAPVDS